MIQDGDFSEQRAKVRLLMKRAAAGTLTRAEIQEAAVTRFGDGTQSVLDVIRPAMKPMLGMIPWRPIAELPEALKDGRWLLLSGGIIDYGWDGETQPPMVVAQWVGNDKMVESAWHFAWYDSGYYGEYKSPTHFAEISQPSADAVTITLSNKVRTPAV